LRPVTSLIQRGGGTPQSTACRRWRWQAAAVAWTAGYPRDERRGATCGCRRYRRSQQPSAADINTPARPSAV